MRKALFVSCIALYGFYCEVSAAPPRNTWEVTQFIWDCGIVALCDVGPDHHPLAFFANEYSSTFHPERYTDIRPGDTVWLQCRFIAQFYAQIVPYLPGPIVLVVSVGDESFPSETRLSPQQIATFLADDKIAHIFAQNCDLPAPHPKVTLLPIGIDYHTIAYKGENGGWGEIGSPLAQEAQLKTILRQLLPTSQRKKQAFVDFQFSDSIRGGEKKRYLQLGEDRTTIFHRLQQTGLIAHAAWMRRSALWRTKGEYAFSISPHGNGLDCHRTWEDLLLGCIVIVKTSPLDHLYEGLPVVIVHDWGEVTAPNLDKWFEQYKDAFTNSAYRAKLTHRYWMDLIEQAARPYRER